MTNTKRRERFIKLYLDPNLTNEEVAKKIGVSLSTVLRWANDLREEGVELPKKRPGPKSLI